MRRAHFAVVGLAALLLVGMLGGCTRVRLNDIEPPREDRDRVELRGADEAEVALTMGAGELRVGTTGDRGVLMDADFTYQPDSWRPEVAYDVSRGTGILSVTQPETGRFPFGNHKNEWDVLLSEDVPMRLDVDLGAGESTLELGGLRLSDLSVDLGAGDVTIDLSGDWEDDLDADVNAGVGSLTLIVPENVGVRLAGLEKGLGSFEADGFVVDGDAYVNRAYEDSDITLDLRVSRGIGEITVTLVP